EADRVLHRRLAMVVDGRIDRGGVIGELLGGLGKTFGGAHHGGALSLGKAVAVAFGARGREHRRQGARGHDGIALVAMPAVEVEPELGGRRARHPIISSSALPLLRTISPRAAMSLAVDTSRPCASSTSLSRTGPIASMSSRSSLPERADILEKNSSLM